jgi:Fic family protein
VETKSVLKAVAAAHAALGELRGMGEIIPNQNLILRSIALQEARMSSEIENIVTTSDEVYKAMDGSQEKTLEPATKEVLRYQEALWHGVQAIQQRPLRVSLFLEIVSILKNESMTLRSKSGARISDGRGGVLYTPPEGEFVIREKLEALELFLERDQDFDPLVKMAMAHYQFEAIHPFADGNGRTGRILNVLFLLQQKLLKAPILYLSRYIIEHKSAYYEGLRLVTEEGAWEPWVLSLLEGVTVTAKAAIAQIQDIRNAILHFQSELQEKDPKLARLELVHILFQQPYCRIRDFEKAGIAKRQAASEYLQALASRGLLRPVKVGTQVLYLNETLLKILGK